MAATTTGSLSALIPSEVIEGNIISNMGDKASLIDLCRVKTGFKAVEFAELESLTAGAVVEGAAIVPVAVTPVGTVVTATPQEIAPVQLTRMAIETNEAGDWLSLGKNLGRALSDRMNVQICSTFDDVFAAARNSAASTDGAGNPLALNLQTLELAIEIAEGNNSIGKEFGGPQGLACVLHPSQISAIRADVRAAGSFISREDILAANPALDSRGLMFGYYGVAIYMSMGVQTSAHVNGLGTGVELQTGIALAAGNTRKGALFAIGDAHGYCMQKPANLRMEDTALIATGGVNMVAGYVGDVARVSSQLTLIQSL
tara:strand:+ start:451 stop:1395 length:945 start_codon:yes stop_codon:yes gene_type:complete